MKLVIIPALILAAGLMRPALGADLAGADGTSFRCLPRNAVTSLLPAAGYGDVRVVGRQKGSIYFDAHRDGAWYRIAVDDCTAEIVSDQREPAPK